MYMYKCIYIIYTLLFTLNEPNETQAHLYKAVSVAVCCGVLRCVAVCCAVLRCVAMCHSMLECVAVCHNYLHQM